MLNIGTIGTSWITSAMLEAVVLSGAYHIRGIYSRDAKRAQALAERFGADYYCDELNNLVFDPEIQVIYIASPNAIHFEQAQRAIKAGKHVIVEKPAFANLDEWHEIVRLAQYNEVMVFEAALHVHNQNFKRLAQMVALKAKTAKQPFLGANLNIGQYSSKYEAYLAAQTDETALPNVFNAQMAGGTLMDMGIYPIYVMVALWGLPKTVRYHAITNQKQIDLFGTAICTYQDFQVTIFMSKAVHATLPSEIYYDDETLVIEGITRIDSVALLNRQGQRALISQYQPKHEMLDEFVHFAEMITEPHDPVQQKRYQGWLKLSLEVAQVMAQLKQSAQIS